MLAAFLRIVSATLTSVALFAGCATFTSTNVALKHDPPDRAADSANLRKVVRIVDGDTIILDSKEKVRLIGVDTPETVHPSKAVQCFGSEAKTFLRSMLEGKTIRLSLDPRYAKQNHKDKYGRTLGYVYLDDGRLLNVEIIRLGYGRAYTRFPFQYAAQFVDVEKTAQRNGAGLWSNCPVS